MNQKTTKLIRKFCKLYNCSFRQHKNWWTNTPVCDRSKFRFDLQHAILCRESKNGS